MSERQRAGPRSYDAAGHQNSPGAASLLVDIQLTRGAFTVGAAFTALPGQTLAILGPNGAGKSTILSVVAGLTRPDRGSVSLGERPLTRIGPADGAASDLLVPPAARRIGLMGQDPLLFPHLSALENIAFGPRSQGAPRAVASAQATDWLERMGLSTFASRKPAQLSGGQRQRVALARALAANPAALLLDEPLGALDAATAPEIRQLLRGHLAERGIPVVLVTHDVLDAAVLADRVIVLERGQVVDDGPTAAVLTAPRSAFGAALAGLNLVHGMAIESAAAGTTATLRTADGGLSLSGVPQSALARGDPVAAVFSPTAVAVFPIQAAAAAQAGSPRNHWAATVISLQAGTAAIRLRTGGAAEVAADLTAAAVAELGLTTGSGVYLMVKSTEVRIHRR